MRLSQMVRAFEALPAPLTKVAVDYARRQLHMDHPLISDFSKDGLLWVVTVSSHGKENDLTLDPRQQKVVSVN